MRLKLSNELKKAISQLPDKEKDKLLFRLLPKNEDLVRKLEFDLLEGGDTTELRREELKEQMEKVWQKYPYHYYSPGYLMMTLRDMSGFITRHVKTTKDKVGEVELNLYMLVQAFDRNEDELLQANPYKMRKFNEYVIKRAQKVLTLLDKLHEDYRLEFQEDLDKLGRLIGNQPNTMKVAIQLGFDVNELLDLD